jgi:hypothetical protein
MTPVEERAENALWWIAAVAAFAAWQGGAWLAARGRWQRAKERGAALPPPRLVDGLPDTLAVFLLNIRPVAFGFLPIFAGTVWTVLVFFWIGLPLGSVYGSAVGAGCGILVWCVGVATGAAVLTRLGERRRERQMRLCAIIAAELKAEAEKV